jgi:hypothetical protein
VRYLLEKVMDVSNHPLTRSTCAAYLGSFLARSTLVPTQLVQEPLQSTFPPRLPLVTPNARGAYRVFYPSPEPMGAPVRHTEPGHDARRRGPRPLLLRVPGRLLRRLLQIPAARPPHTRTRAPARTRSVVSA